MKTEELMIGDWVYGCTDPYETDRDRKKYPVKVIRIDADGDTMTEGENPFTEPYEDEWWNLEPIPLTPEVLEKNGFKSWEHGYIWKERIGMGGQTTSASSPIEIIIYEGGHSVIMNPHDGKDFQGSIDNVHQLQHALRLCGIEKEIVI